MWKFKLIIPADFRTKIRCNLKIILKSRKLQLNSVDFCRKSAHYIFFLRIFCRKFLARFREISFFWKQKKLGDIGLLHTFSNKSKNTICQQSLLCEKSNTKTFPKSSIHYKNCFCSFETALNLFSCLTAADENSVFSTILLFFKLFLWVTIVNWTIFQIFWHKLSQPRKKMLPALFRQKI